MVFNKARFLRSATNPSGYPDHPLAEVALAGRSNVGKSSLINTLVPVKSLARVGKRPGRTQTINFYCLDESLALVDLPGYGYAEVPEKVRCAWGPMIEEYLSGRDQLRAVLLLLDGRHGPTPDDVTMWEWLAATPFDKLPVATKWDKVKKSARSRQQQAIEDALGAPVLPFSAKSAEGRGELIGFLKRSVYG